MSTFWQPVARLRKNSFKIKHFAKNLMQPKLNQFSNKKGVIGKPGTPKRHPKQAAPPSTHLSTKYPPCWDPTIVFPQFVFCSSWEGNFYHLFFFIQTYLKWKKRDKWSFNIYPIRAFDFEIKIMFVTRNSWKLPEVITHFLLTSQHFFLFLPHLCTWRTN